MNCTCIVYLCAFVVTSNIYIYIYIYIHIHVAQPIFRRHSIDVSHELQVPTVLNPAQITYTYSVEDFGLLRHSRERQSSVFQPFALSWQTHIERERTLFLFYHPRDFLCCVLLHLLTIINHLSRTEVFAVFYFGGSFAN